MSSIADLFASQKGFFVTQGTRPIAERIRILKKLGRLLSDQEENLCKAVHADFGKSPFETYETELGSLQHEIRWFCRHLHGLARPSRVRTNLANLPGSSFILQEPFGCALIMSTWNYPFLLSLKPAISALAAGNTVILKPSEMAPVSSSVMAELINRNLDPLWISVVEGGVETARELLGLPFDKIFYTGSTRVGKMVMSAAADHLSSVTLELGGKSPCIVFPDANLNTAVKRIAWGKFLNAGQTCIASDYLLIHHDIADKVLAGLQKQVEIMFGKDPLLSPWLCEMVNDHHFKRIKQIIDGSQVLYGGQCDPGRMKISPTILSPGSPDDPLVQEEIFGPVLPVFLFRTLDQMTEILARWPKPLAMYIFSRSRRIQRYLIRNFPAGGVCINDTVMQIGNPNLPFGGVGPSGSGRYHHEAGFREFSNPKSILKKAVWIDPPFKYPPYTGFKRWIIRRLI